MQLLIVGRVTRGQEVHVLAALNTDVFSSFGFPLRASIPIRMPTRARRKSPHPMRIHDRPQLSP